VAAANERAAAAEAAAQSAGSAAARAAVRERESVEARLRTALREVEEQRTRHAQEMDHVEVGGCPPVLLVVCCWLLGRGQASVLCMGGGAGQCSGQRHAALVICAGSITANAQVLTAHATCPSPSPCPPWPGARQGGARAQGGGAEWRAGAGRPAGRPTQVDGGGAGCAAGGAEAHVTAPFFNCVIVGVV
jgi:hypothetical protein